MGAPDGEGDTVGNGVGDVGGDGVGDAVGTGEGEGLGDGVGAGLSRPAWPNSSANTKIRPNTVTINATQTRETGSSTYGVSSGNGRGVLSVGSVIGADYAGAGPPDACAAPPSGAV